MAGLTESTFARAMVNGAPQIPLEAAREAARRSQCANNLKQIALAMHNYHDVFKSFPPAVITDKNGRPMHSWRVAILPFIEQAALYKNYKFDEPWDGPNNRNLDNIAIPVFRCPSDPGHGPETAGAVVTVTFATPVLVRLLVTVPVTVNARTGVGDDVAASVGDVGPCRAGDRLQPANVAVSKTAAARKRKFMGHLDDGQGGEPVFAAPAVD